MDEGSRRPARGATEDGVQPAWVIRAANLGDAVAIAKLSTALGYPSTAGETSARLAALVAEPAHFLVVADGGSGILGWVAAERRMSLESGERAEIVGLVVAEAARRQGVGLALVSAAEAWAAAQGLTVMSVRSNVARTESHPFYEALGYVRQKTQHVYVRSLRDGPEGGRDVWRPAMP